MKLIFISFIVSLCSLASLASDISDKRAKELTHLVRHDCGSCHGMTLKGGLGPALRAKDLKTKTDEQLYLTIFFGRESLAMPPWKGILSKGEINWIIKYLRKLK